MGLLKWSIILAIASIIFGVFGFTGVAHGFADVAKILFAIFIFFFILFIVVGPFIVKKVF